MASKESFRWLLQKLKEDRELDALTEDYIAIGLKHRIIMSPSKGPYGERGKDIVAVENEETGDYCSYIIKRGDLNQNLDGAFGILKQMEQAMIDNLEIERYRGKSRTVVVVHNGKEGYRGAIDRFERSCRSIENKINSILLLRPIERWDIEVLTNKFFDHIEALKRNAELKRYCDQLQQSYEFILDFKYDYEILRPSEEANSDKIMLTEKLYKNIMESEYRLGPFKRKDHNG